MDEAKANADAGAPATSPTDYEFTPEENVAISATSRKMRAVAIVAMIWGFLDVATALALLGAMVLSTEHMPILRSFRTNTPVLTAVTTCISGVFKIIFGVLILPASRSFDAVVETEGNDIAHLMSAISSLRQLFSAQFLAMVLALGALALSVVVGVLALVLK